MEKNLEKSVLTYESGKPEGMHFSHFSAEQVLAVPITYRNLEAESVYGNRKFTISVPDHFDF
jgi:hypothetical protein